ncbi:MAG TPA: ABC transporter ATP-binding protein [Acidimicrobiales bacterium]|nr:ABC transporter ATP-binding protein [Acidimicrobiales bacterium]
MSSLLQTRGITKRFAGIAALCEVDLDVDEGERVGLIGPNGAGKTTFFNCILGFLRPDRGNVTLGGEDISGLRVHERARRGIGRTFQRIELFPDSTVRDHLVIADRVSRRERRFLPDVRRWVQSDPEEVRRCDEVLELLGLRDLADEPIERLSLGQGRLVEVARALMTQPRLLLLDEPSSGLDRRETSALAATLREVQEQRGFAILLVEHDIELVGSFTTRSYLLDFGQVLLSGPTTEVMSSTAMRQAYLGDAEVPA